eukprot:scaffold1422_cov297-Prasinococcus_capsulatus_cf.AAC.13
MHCCGHGAGVSQGSGAPIGRAVGRAQDGVQAALDPARAAGRGPRTVPVHPASGARASAEALGDKRERCFVAGSVVFASTDRDVVVATTKSHEVQARPHLPRAQLLQEPGQTSLPRREDENRVAAGGGRRVMRCSRLRSGCRRTGGCRGAEAPLALRELVRDGRGVQAQGLPAPRTVAQWVPASGPQPRCLAAGAMSAHFCGSMLVPADDVQCIATRAPAPN